MTAADFSPFCITAPVDARLPGGGGNQICGLYDVAPTKFGRVNNLVTQASHYGKLTLVNDFFNLSFNTRLGSGAQLGGGVDGGRTVSDRCFLVDSPQELLYCHVVTPWSAVTQLKLHGSYLLPRDVRVSGTFQNTPGPQILANYPARNAEIAPSLGRNLAAGVGGVATVPLLEPQTRFEDRRVQLDLRLTKLIRLSSNLRLEANLDLYNVLNASDVNLVNNTYGPQWLRPVNDAYAGGAILTGRLVEFGGRLTF